jgi:hypothetical protein
LTEIKTYITYIYVFYVRQKQTNIYKCVYIKKNRAAFYYKMRSVWILDYKWCRYKNYKVIKLYILKSISGVEKSRPVLISVNAQFIYIYIQVRKNISKNIFTWKIEGSRGKNKELWSLNTCARTGKSFLSCLVLSCLVLSCLVLYGDNQYYLGIFNNKIYIHTFIHSYI